MPFPLLFHRLLTFGRRSEILAIDYIRSLGYRIVTSGYRTKDGEIDVVAWEGATLVFVEVKARRNSDRKSTRLNSSHDQISYAVFCLKKTKLDEGVQVSARSAYYLAPDNPHQHTA